MIGFESVQYSLRNIAHRKARSFLTVLSIFIGIATIFIFISFGLGLYSYVNEFVEGGSANKVLVQAKGQMGAPGLDDTFKLDDSDLRAVEKSAGVYEATGSYIEIAQVEFRDELKYVFLLGYNPAVPLVIELSNIDIFEGRQLNEGDVGKVVLGYNYFLDDKIFSRGVRINDKIKIEGKEMRVVGFYGPVGNPQDDSNVYVVNDVIDDIYPNENNSYGWIIAEIDQDNVDRVVENIEKNLRKSRGLDEGKEDFFVQSFSDLIESYSGVLDIIVGFIILIALVSVFVSAVNTANTMITSVIERTKEIGVIKAIGGKNSEIFGIFLFESAFLGFIAGVIGVLLGWGLATFGGVVLENLGWGFLSPLFPAYLFFGLILFAVITGAISGAIPAWQASKTNIVDALRYE